MIPCPECGFKLTKTAGGNISANGTRADYRICKNEDCTKYGESARTIKPPNGAEYFDAWVENSALNLNPAEALRILRQMVRDDISWFNEVTDETRQFASGTFDILF